eukprot:Hpha_TRINITY_DN28157_c0_g1::TRINITY_DN28157_c0_g1_i1::g.103233::m.103233
MALAWSEPFPCSLKAGEPPRLTPVAAGYELWLLHASVLSGVAELRWAPSSGSPGAGGGEGVVVVRAGRPHCFQRRSGRLAHMSGVALSARGEDIVLQCAWKIVNPHVANNESESDPPSPRSLPEGTSPWRSDPRWGPESDEIAPPLLPADAADLSEGEIHEAMRIEEGRSEVLGEDNPEAISLPSLPDEATAGRRRSLRFVRRATEDSSCAAATAVALTASQEIVQRVVQPPNRWLLRSPRAGPVPSPQGGPVKSALKRLRGTRPRSPTASPRTGAIDLSQPPIRKRVKFSNRSPDIRWTTPETQPLSGSSVDGGPIDLGRPLYPVPGLKRAGGGQKAKKTLTRTSGDYDTELGSDGSSEMERLLTQGRQAPAHRPFLRSTVTPAHLRPQVIR